MGICMTIGTGFGVAVGTATDNIGTGIPIGVGVGVAIGAAFSRSFLPSSITVKENSSLVMTGRTYPSMICFLQPGISLP